MDDTSTFVSMRNQVFAFLYLVTMAAFLAIVGHGACLSKEVRERQMHELNEDPLKGKTANQYLRK